MGARLPGTGPGTPNLIVMGSVVAGETVQDVRLLSRDNIVSVGFNATSSSLEALAANAARRGLMIQNLSDTRVLCRFGAVPVATLDAEEGFAIEPNGGSQVWTFNVDVRALNVIHAGSGNKRLLITEWSGVLVGWSGA